MQEAHVAVTSDRPTALAVKVAVLVVTIWTLQIAEALLDQVGEGGFARLAGAKISSTVLLAPMRNFSNSV